MGTLIRSDGKVRKGSTQNLFDAICLMGPTASGKTALAMAMCNVLPCEIISVDSAMVYRGMDIGSAKPGKALLEQYPHRLVDIREPSSPYSAAEFRNDALSSMRNIVARGKIPLLVGGSMMYFKVLQQGLANLPSANETVRNEIMAIVEKRGWEAAHEMLSEVDPEAANRLHPNDPQRIQRALEVYMVSGRSLSDFHREQSPACEEFQFVNIAVAPSERKKLHEGIENRCRQMFSDGFVDEVKQLYSENSLGLHLPSIRSVGYRQVWQYLDGHISEESLIEKCIIATRQLAKRQLTWLRNWHDRVYWIESLSSGILSEVMTVVNRTLRHFPGNMDTGY